jgi:hypothetical protein
MTYFLPVFFVCLVNGVCDFVYTDPLPSQAECEAEIEEKSNVLESMPTVHGYRPTCLEITVPDTVRT